MHIIFNKKSTALLAAAITFSLSACTFNTADRSVQGTETGKIVVFSPLSSKEIASISFNQRFIDSLPAQHQLEQAICAGNYVIEARSIKSNMAEFEKTPTLTNKSKNKFQKNVSITHPEIAPLLASLNVEVKKDQVQYVALSQNKNKKWELKQVNPAEFSQLAAMPMVNSKFIRRLSNDMVKCAK